MFLSKSGVGRGRDPNVTDRIFRFDPILFFRSRTCFKRLLTGIGSDGFRDGCVTQSFDTPNQSPWQAKHRLSRGEFKRTNRGFFSVQE